MTKPSSINATAKKGGGGAAAGGGVDFQAVVAAIAGAHLLEGTPVGWASGAQDVPVDVWSETGGPGDDVRLTLKSGEVVEVQAKKRLAKGSRLWDALTALAKGVDQKQIGYGVLAVTADSSDTIKNDLSLDLKRIGEERGDGLSGTGAEFEMLLQVQGIPKTVCRRLTIKVVYGLDQDGADIKAAKKVLATVCAAGQDQDSAWNSLYRDAVALMRRRGRWDTAGLVQILSRDGVTFADSSNPAGTASKWLRWTLASNQGVPLLGLGKLIPYEFMVPLKARPASERGSRTPSDVLRSYHDSGERSSALEDDTFDAEWVAWFQPRCLIFGGPGLGKSTLLSFTARRFAERGRPTLNVELKRIAAAVAGGESFENALLSQGFEGSGISAEEFRRSGISRWTLLADGLDDCGPHQALIADRLAKFAHGHSHVHIVVTTRPLEDSHACLEAWKRYDLLQPEPSLVETNLSRLLDGAGIVSAKSTAKRQLGNSSARDAIARRPQLLAMAASLVAQGETLSGNRAELYGKFVRLFEKRLTPAVLLPSDVPRICIDAAGWKVIENPLTLRTDVEAFAASDIVQRYHGDMLRALEMARPALDHWNAAGLIETLHLALGAVVTFVHRTFAEFAAARRLASAPEPFRAAELQRVADLESWSEVVALASGLAGDAVFKVLLERQPTRVSDVTRMLEFMSNRNALVSRPLEDEASQQAFALVRSRPAEAIAIGLALSRLAAVRPELVVERAQNLRDSTLVFERLVAWVVLSSSAGAATVDEIKAALEDVTEGLDRGEGVGVGSKQDAARQLGELLQRIGAQLLWKTPPEQIGDVLQGVLSHAAFRTFGFVSLQKAILKQRDLLPKAPDEPAVVRIPISQVLAPSDEWKEQASAGMTSVMAAIAGEEAPHQPTSGSYPDLSGFVRLIGLYQVEMPDVLKWSAGGFAEPLQEVMRVLVAMSPFEAKGVQEQASHAVAELRAQPKPDPFGLTLPSVDVPSLKLVEATRAAPNWRLIESASHHPSRWLSGLARFLLEQRSR